MSETEADSLVLLIEDEEDMAELVGTLLRKARFKTAIAHSAWKGIAMAEELHPKVIILDLMLSRLDGFEVLKRLKDPPPHQQHPRHHPHGENGSIQLHQGTGTRGR
jgi:DNA-binding response OmpR family regulator